MKLGDPKNIWTGRKVTTEDIENVSALNRKAVLYNIFREISCKGETRHRYDFSGGFISFLMATGEALYRYPDLAEAHEDDGTEEADFMATMSIISRYLALKRIMERRTAGLPEWTLKSISQEITQKEITDEEALLLKAYKSLPAEDTYFDELYGLTRLVYGLIRYTKDTDRVIPLLKKMGEDFVTGK